MGFYGPSKPVEQTQPEQKAEQQANRSENGWLFEALLYSFLAGLVILLVLHRA